MELYLMQHGQAVAKEEDPEQPLSREGVEAIKASAAAIRRMGLHFDVIIASPKRRSRQTAALVAEAVNYPYSDIVETELVKPMTAPGETLKFLQQYLGEGAVLIAGHLPSLGEIASSLLSDGSKVHLHFENGGLCHLSVPNLPTYEAQLRWSLTAAQLAMLAK
ncbi:hypothetical protein DESUT3_38220 [Desulfuromonas versatilis]|uniref:Phosphohistidine phosphatase SixA n=1 Tax=Desulfuromonas versatilis TaxID=2802975 RepID=A0ABM8HWP5_9BACT|nr:phosphohistidine phosphatase SixA [Desulfuromonas versatilis]BCR06753.1 hypothetical protein DESUT3_38220 [Desulfuromonas versatilis]